MWWMIGVAILVAWFVYRCFVPTKRQRAMIAQLERMMERERDCAAMGYSDEYLEKWYPWLVAQFKAEKGSKS